VPPDTDPPAPAAPHPAATSRQPGPSVPPPTVALPPPLPGLGGLPPEQAAIRARCIHPRSQLYPPTGDAERSIPERFEEMVRRYPDRLAVKATDGAALTYRQLNERANRIAHAILAERGPAPEPVALLFRQGLPMIAPLLGVLKAGKFFVPLDPEYPPHLTRHMLQDAGAGLLVTDAHLESGVTEIGLPADVRVLNTDALDGDLPTDDPGLPIGPNDTACLLYTSGSTGQPKGVMRTHRTWTDVAPICPEDRFVMLAAISSVAVNSIFDTLVAGAALLPYDLKREGAVGLAPFLTQERITYFLSGSSVFRALMATLAPGEVLPHVRVLRLAGETVLPSDVALYRAHFSESAVLITGLSSSEAGRSRVFYLDKSTEVTTKTVPVGYADSDDCEVVLEDEHGREASGGEIGEIVIRGRHLSPGYWRRPDLTAARFLPDPARPGWRVYRTGDLGRLQPDGCLEHLGRKDFQVKIRGNRVDLPEIEAALTATQGVREAVVLPREDRLGGQHLTAFVVPDVQPGPTASALRAALAERLPSFMVPSAFVLMDALPKLPGGKVDRLALPHPAGGRPELANPYVRADSVREELLAALWADVLDVGPVGIHDDFLELGGDSLLAASLIARVQSAFQRRIPMATLAQAPTVAKMAALLEDEAFAPNTSCLVPLQPEGSRTPFFCVHGIGGSAFGFLALARELAPDQPFFGLEAPGWGGEDSPLGSLEAMAAQYIAEVRTVQPRGPYCLGAYSWGGHVAFEMAQQLHAQGEEVRLLALLDCRSIPAPHLENPLLRVARRAVQSCREALRLAPLLLHPSALRHHLSERTRVAEASGRPFIEGHHAALGKRYKPSPYPGPITLFRCIDGKAAGASDMQDGWGKLSEAGVQVHAVRGSHLTLLGKPYVEGLAEQLDACLRVAQTGPEARDGPAVLDRPGSPTPTAPA